MNPTTSAPLPPPPDERRLVLFDIDGTLLSAAGVSASALREALVEHFGTTGPLEGYDYSGKTDPQIVRELMRGAGWAEASIEDRMAQTLALYLRLLEERLRPEHVRAKPGVVDLVLALAADPRVTLGLLTGNLEPGARLKIEPLGLNGHFPFGAFGSDHEQRHRLPAVAVQRALGHTGHRFEGKRVVIVGDSIHDVRCGRSLGVRAVAVATGITPLETLAAEDPDDLLEDCSDLERGLRAVLG
jgi:phosphoglycolate phosphatase-like HAD superfamily hydrolase